MRKALIVGLNDYPECPLEGCVNDANRLASVIKKNGDGSPNFDIKLITKSATRPLLRQNIEDLFSGDNDVALFYFSGHGFINSHGGYIVTTDFETHDEGILMDDILKIANKSKARNKVVILDCCHSGIFGSGTFGQDENPLAQLSDGLTVLTASKKDEYAMEYGGSGVFTSLLVNGLDGGAADLKGNISPGGLYAYIDEALGAWEQRPIFKTNVSHFTPLRTVPPRIPIETMRKLNQYFETPEQEFQLDPSYEDTMKDVATKEHVQIFKDLQKFQSVGLVVPVNAEFMYFAAINSKSCRLTALGYQYWRLANEEKL